MRVSWLLFVIACSKAEAVEERREAPKPAPVVAKKPRHVVMAEQVVAALVANDPAKLPPMSKLGKEHMGEAMVREGFGELVEKLEEAKIERAKLTFVKAETPGLDDMFETVDVTLGYEGRRLTFHFNAMPRDGYAFMGTSSWFKWVP